MKSKKRNLTKKNEKGMSEAMKKPPHPACIMLADPSVPKPHRIAIIREFLTSEEAYAQAAQDWLLASLSATSAESVYREKLGQVTATLEQLEQGPCRGGYITQVLAPNEAGLRQGLVILDDGSPVYTVIPNEELAKALRPGQRVILDGQARAILRPALPAPTVGQIARLERVLGPDSVEVGLRADGEKAVMFVPQDLAEQIDSGKVRPGSSLIVNPRTSFVLSAIPPEEGLSHYRFLQHAEVPKVSVREHIGAPPRVIEDVAHHVYMELNHPQIRRRYRLRRCCTKLLCGVSGTGKSLAIDATHRRIYEIASGHTGVPVEQLPNRVFRVRQSQLLSMWWGETEKNFDRAMDEVEQLADEPFRTPDGRVVKLPVLVILEEVDGLGQVRGQEAVHSRVLPVLLQRLDPNRLELSDRLIVVLATTNVPHLVDSALMRRLGGSIEHFGRLRRAAARAVLGKLVKDIPPASDNGCEAGEIWQHNIDDLVTWLFGPNSSDPGLVELTYAGWTNPVVKYRRDFLTGALLDRAVQQAASEAAMRDEQSGEPSGISLAQLARALDEQLRGIARQLNEHNASIYTDIPENVRVATVRHIQQPIRLPFEYQLA